MAEKFPSKDAARETKAPGWQSKPGAAAPAGAPKPSGGRPAPQVAQVIRGADGNEIRGIVRVAGRDLKGQFKIGRAIASIKGMGLNVGQIVAGIVVEKMKLTPKTMIGELSEDQIRQLEQILSHPEAHGVPLFMLNRQREVASGETRHLLATDLGFAVKQDIEHDKDIYTWRGYRHAYGQKVRGQHTRSTGRSGMTVGVMRKAILAKAGTVTTGAAAQAAGAPAPAAGGKKEDKGAPKAVASAAPAAGAKPAAGGAQKAAAPAGKPAAGAKAPEKK